jgi:hypothetical protein
VDGVEILADNDTDFIAEGEIVGDDIHDLRKEFVPQYFGIAAEERDINLVVNVADPIMISLLLRVELHALLVFELRGAVSLEKGENLGVLADTRGSIKNEIGESVQRGWKAPKPCGELGVEIVLFYGIDIVFVMCLVEFHFARKNETK